jgi:DNA-binding transcriptional LysR family regulator
MVDSGEAIRQAALAGLGIVQHSVLTLQQDIDEGRLPGAARLPATTAPHAFAALTDQAAAADRLLVYRLLFAGD